MYIFHSVFSRISSLGFPGPLWRGIELSDSEAGPACSSEPLQMAPCSPSTGCLLVCFSSPPLTPPGLLLRFVYLQTALILEGPLWAMAGPFCWPFWPLVSLAQRPGLGEAGGSQVPVSLSGQTILVLNTLQGAQKGGNEHRGQLVILQVASGIGSLLRTSSCRPSRAGAELPEKLFCG